MTDKFILIRVPEGEFDTEDYSAIELACQIQGVLSDGGLTSSPVFRPGIPFDLGFLPTWVISDSCPNRRMFKAALTSRS